MTDKINNIQNGNEYFKYQNTGIKTDSQDEISLFSLIDEENIKNDYEYQLGENTYDEINNIGQTENEETEKQAEELYSMLSEIKDNQGIISSAWNSLKSFTGIGTSTKKCEKAIEDFKSGKITFEEAQSKISEFDSKQESSVNTFSNVVTGIAVSISIGSAIATGGLSLAAIGTSALVGGLTKTGLKFADRATNKVKGDAVDGKQLVKDGLTGAVEGVATTLTMGAGAVAKTAENAAKGTLGNMIKSGAKEGIKTGGISGAVTGAGEYAIDAALEDDVRFNAGDMLENTGKTALTGAVFGGVFGGISGGINYAKSSLKSNNTKSPDIIEDDTVSKLDDSKNQVMQNDETVKSAPDSADSEIQVMQNDETVKSAPDSADSEIQVMQNDETGIVSGAGQTMNDPSIPPEINRELNNNTELLIKKTNEHISEAEEQIKEVFKDTGRVKNGGKITARAKEKDSVLAKLTKKFKNHKLKTTDYNASEAAIGDAYGTRVQLRSLTPEETKSIIDDCLDGYNVDYNDFINYMHNEASSLNSSQIETLDEISGTVIDLLKESQTQDAVDAIIKAISDPDNPISVTELNNYGDDISSYFTNRQNQLIADAYEKANPGQKLNIVTKINNNEKIIIQPKYDMETGEILLYQDSNGNVFTKDASGNFTGGAGDIYSADGELIRKNTQNAIYKNNGAEKDSGYASSQMNVVHKFKDGQTGLGELQVRGTELNAFADAEHIPYDIRTGKIKPDNLKYSDIYETIKSMDENSYQLYNQYIKDTYKALRLNELGIPTELPSMNNLKFTSSAEFGAKDITNAVKKIDMNGLIEISKRD